MVLNSSIRGTFKNLTNHHTFQHHPGQNPQFHDWAHQEYRALHTNPLCQDIVIAGQAKQHAINYIAQHQTKPNGDEMSGYIAIARRAEDRGNLVLGRAISEFMWGIFETPHKFSSMHEAQQIVNSTEPPVHLNHVTIETDDAFEIVLNDWRTPSH